MTNVTHALVQCQLRLRSALAKQNRGVQESSPRNAPASAISIMVATAFSRVSRRPSSSDIISMPYTIFATVAPEILSGLD